MQFRAQVTSGEHVNCILVVNMAHGKIWQYDLYSDFIIKDVFIQCLLLYLYFNIEICI